MKNLRYAILLLAAASIVVSEPALEALQARTGPPRSGEAKN